MCIMRRLQQLEEHITVQQEARQIGSANNALVTQLKTTLQYRKKEVERHGTY